MFSAVPITGTANYCNLAGSFPIINTLPTQTTGTTAKIDGIIGPAVSFAEPSQSWGIDIIGTAAHLTFSSFTAAAIFRCPSNDPNFATVVGAKTGTGGGQTAVVYLNNSGELILAYPSSIHSGITPTVGRTYFVAVSTVGISGQPVYFIIRDLVSGKISTASVTQSIGSSWTVRYFFLGADGGGSGFIQSLAAGMVSPIALTQPQLLQWANDPWSFWYPNAFDLVDLLNTTLPTAPSLVPGLLFPSQMAALGPKNRYARTTPSGLPIIVAPPGVQGGNLPIMGVG
jgi:hypothetical protein